MSRRKISNKRLSHKIRARKAPLCVLPMTTYHLRHREKQLLKESMKKQKMEDIQHTPFPPPSIQCPVENIHHQVGRSVKKSWRLKPILIRPMTNIHFSVLRWILLVIFIYIAAGTTIVLMNDGAESLKNILVYSIIGFFTFFMGYLGWILARDVLEMVSGNKTLLNETELEA